MSTSHEEPGKEKNLFERQPVMCGLFIGLVVLGMGLLFSFPNDVNEMPPGKLLLGVCTLFSPMLTVFLINLAKDNEKH